ncbi:MAG: hypothetical protein ACTSX9_00615 [Candidatus Njordarchaeales archaeon]
MVLFYVRREFLDALIKGEKKAELRVGESWIKVAEKIRTGRLKPIAIFKWRNRVVVREIYDIKVYPSIRKALANGRWRLLGLKAKTYPEAIDEVRKLYHKGAKGHAVMFFLRKPKSFSREDALALVKQVDENAELEN